MPVVGSRQNRYLIISSLGALGKMAKHLFHILWFLMMLAPAAAQSGDPAKDRAFLQAPVFYPAVDYQSFEAFPNCSEEFVREVKYFGCRDSRTLYETALANAKAKGQPLMVIFGFNRCPYCEVLERTVFDKKKPMLSGHVVRYFSKPALQSFVNEAQPLGIPLLRLHARSDHGLKLADELGITKMAQVRGWHRVWSPFIVFINPETGAMASESEWEAEDVYCDWPMNVAVSLEEIGLATKGTPLTERKRCAKK